MKDYKEGKKCLADIDADPTKCLRYKEGLIKGRCRWHDTFRDECNVPPGPSPYPWPIKGYHPHG